MQNLRMPAHYAAIGTSEQRVIQGGGPVSDALVDFMDNLLFTAVRAVIGLSQELAGGILDMFMQF